MSVFGVVFSCLFAVFCFINDSDPKMTVFHSAVKGQSTVNLSFSFSFCDKIPFSRLLFHVCALDMR